MALDRIRHRLFVGTRIPPEMTVYDSLSGREIQSLPAPDTMDGVKDPDHYDVISKIKTRPGSGTSLFEPQLNAFYVASQAIGNQKGGDTGIRAGAVREIVQIWRFGAALPSQFAW